MSLMLSYVKNKNIQWKKKLYITPLMMKTFRWNMFAVRWQNSWRLIQTPHHNHSINESKCHKLVKIFVIYSHIHCSLAQYIYIFILPIELSIPICRGIKKNWHWNWMNATESTSKWQSYWILSLGRMMQDKPHVERKGTNSMIVIDVCIASFTQYYFLWCSIPECVLNA